MNLSLTSIKPNKDFDDVGLRIVSGKKWSLKRTDGFFQRKTIVIKLKQSNCSLW